MTKAYADIGQGLAADHDRARAELAVRRNDSVRAEEGVQVASARLAQLLHIDARHDGRGNPYYWIAYARGVKPAGKDGTDLAALADNRIAVTPLRLDLTDPSFLTKLAGIFP